MTIDPLTFILEIVNFLVLIWLLHRFLYRPIKGAIAERSQALNREMTAAKEREQEAQALEERYRQQLAQWEAEKTRQQEEFRQSLAKEQETALAKMRQAVEAERVRLQSLNDQEAAVREERQRQAAVRSALDLSTRLLTRLAGDELDRALLRILGEDLARIPAAERERLQSALAREQGAITVTTARELDAERQKRVRAALSQWGGDELRCSFDQDPQLLSGYRLVIGDQVLHADLGDELAFFGRSLSRAES